MKRSKFIRKVQLHRGQLFSALLQKSPLCWCKHNFADCGKNTTQFRASLMRTGLNLALEPSQALLRGWSFWAFSSSLLAILHNCLFSVAGGKCLFTGCYFLCVLFGKKMIKQTNHYQLLCFGEMSGKYVLFTGFIILWSGITFLEKCLRELTQGWWTTGWKIACGVC